MLATNFARPYNQPTSGRLPLRAATIAAAPANKTHQLSILRARDEDNLGKPDARTGHNSNYVALHFNFMRRTCLGKCPSRCSPTVLRGERNVR